MYLCLSTRQMGLSTLFQNYVHMVYGQKSGQLPWLARSPTQSNKARCSALWNLLSIESDKLEQGDPGSMVQGPFIYSGFCLWGLDYRMNKCLRPSGRSRLIHFINMFRFCLCFCALLFQGPKPVHILIAALFHKGRLEHHELPLNERNFLLWDLFFPIR